MGFPSYTDDLRRGVVRGAATTADVTMKRRRATVVRHQQDTRTTNVTIVFCLLSFVFCLLSSVFCLMGCGFCLLSFVVVRISHVLCPMCSTGTPLSQYLVHDVGAQREECLARQLERSEAVLDELGAEEVARERAAEPPAGRWMDG